MDTSKIKTAKEFAEDKKKGELHGFYRIPRQHYFDAPGFNYSSLKAFAIDPERYKYDQDNPVASKPLSDGSFFDALLTEPELAARCLAPPEIKNRKGNAIKDFCKQAELENIYDAILQHEYEKKFKPMFDSVTDSAVFKRLVKEINPEFCQVAAFVADELGNLRKCLIDYLSPGYDFVVDYKALADITDREWIRQNADFWYYGQAGWYADIISNLAPDTFKDFYFCTVKKTPHFKCVWRAIPFEQMVAGKEQLERQIAPLQESMARNYWPSAYADEVHLIELPEWAMHIKKDEIF